MSICKSSSSSLRYCCLQVSFLLFCQKRAAKSRRECLSPSCSKCKVQCLSSATSKLSPTSPSHKTTVTFQPLHLLTVTVLLFPQDRLRKQPEGELSGAYKVSLLFSVPLAALSPVPFPTIFYFFSEALFFSLRHTPFSPTAYSKLSSLLPASYWWSSVL